MKRTFSNISKLSRNNNSLLRTNFAFYSKHHDISNQPNLKVDINVMENKIMELSQVQQTTTTTQAHTPEEHSSNISNVSNISLDVKSPTNKAISDITIEITKNSEDVAQTQQKISQKKNENPIDSDPKEKDESSEKRKRSKFQSLNALLSGFAFTFLCYLYIKNTLTNQRDEVLFHVNTLNAIKTMEQIEKEKKLIIEANEAEIKRKRDEVLDYHVKNLDFETSAWLKFTRKWNSIWKNISIEIDKQFEKEKSKDIRKQEERERFQKLSSQSNQSS